MTAAIPAFQMPELITMTEPEYTAERARLTAQLAAARSVVESITAAYAPVPNPLHAQVAASWNAAHDAVTALEAALHDLERTWGRRGIDAATLWLVDNNMD